MANQNTMSVRKRVLPNNVKMSIDDAGVVLDNLDSSSSEACASALVTVKAFIDDLYGSVKALQDSIFSKAERYNLSYDPDHVQISASGEEVLMTDSSGKKYWVRIRANNCNRDVAGMNDFLRKEIFDKCPLVGQICHITGLKIRFEHDSTMEDFQYNQNSLPKELLPFFGSAQLSLFSEVDENYVREYDGEQVLNFNFVLNNSSGKGGVK